MQACNEDTNDDVGDDSQILILVSYPTVPTSHKKQPHTKTLHKLNLNGNLQDNFSIPHAYLGLDILTLENL